MPRRFRKTPQPLIDKAGRSDEGRTWWWGLLLAAVGIGMVLLGYTRVHRVAGAPDRTIAEPGLVRAITRGQLSRAVPLVTASMPATSPANQADLKQVETSDDYCPT